MSQNEKRFIKQAVIIPLMIAIAAAVVFFAVLNIFSDQFPFTSDRIYVSDFESSEIIVLDTAITDSVISKRDIPALSDNTLVGSIDTDADSLELIYHANAVNAVGRFNIMPESKAVGEIGTAFVQCYKSDAGFLTKLDVGDIIHVNTYYGDFVYEVTDVQVCDSVLDAKKLGDGIGRALVLCTDGDDGVGISDSLLTVVCTLQSGPEITE